MGRTCLDDINGIIPTLHVPQTPKSVFMNNDQSQSNNKSLTTSNRSHNGKRSTGEIVCNSLVHCIGKGKDPRGRLVAQQQGKTKKG